MWTRDSVDLRGHGGREILNRLYSHRLSSRRLSSQRLSAHADRPDRLTVIVAGFAYGLDSPYLFYSRHVPYDLGDDVLAVDFEYGRNPEFLRLDEAQQEAWFQEELQALRRWLSAKHAYRRLSFVGKSLGTTAVWQLLQDEGLRGRTLRAVWLTPGEKRLEIARLLLRTPLPSLLVYGEEDRYTTDAPLEELRARPTVDLVVVPGADHALECPDPALSIEHLRRYVERLRALYASAPPGEAERHG